jgi:hypothetical protein
MLMPRFLTGEEMEALKFAVGLSQGLSVGDCNDGDEIGRHFLAPGTNFMYYDTGEGSVCYAWILGDEESFCEHFVHEETHRILHARIGLRSCCDYDNVARYAEAVEAEPPASRGEILVKVPDRYLK